MRISGFSSHFSAIAVLLHPATNVLKIQQSLGKERKTQNSLLVNKGKVNKAYCKIQRLGVFWPVSLEDLLFLSPKKDTWIWKGHSLFLRGGTNRVFGKLCFCALPRRGRFDENGKNDEFDSTHWKQGLRSDPRKRRRWRKWRVSLRQRHVLEAGFVLPWFLKCQMLEKTLSELVVKKRRCEGNVKSSGSFFHAQPPSLLILPSEPGSERKSLLRKRDSPYSGSESPGNYSGSSFLPQPGSPL